MLDKGRGRTFWTKSRGPVGHARGVSKRNENRHRGGAHQEKSKRASFRNPEGGVLRMGGRKTVVFASGEGALRRKRPTVLDCAKRKNMSLMQTTTNADAGGKKGKRDELKQRGEGGETQNRPEEPIS